MRKLFFILILTLIPFVSSISTTILPNYQPGETMIIEIQGNILEPIAHSDIIFKRSHVAIAVDYDVKKILDKYYIYAQVPITPNNYTLFINDISTTVNGAAEVIDYNSTFQVFGNLTDYSINPGFILTNTDFYITIKSNLDNSISLNSNFPSERSITINPGVNNILFSINSLSNGFYSVVLGKYTLPVYLMSQTFNSSKEFFINLFPNTIKETLKYNSSKSYNLSITNNGKTDINDIYFIYNKEIFSLDKETISQISPNNSVNLEINLKELKNPIFERISIAKDSYMLGNVTLEILFTENDSEVTNSSDTRYYCSELGGEFCSAEEICSGQSIQSLDGSCCVGTCILEEKSSVNWIIYSLIGVVLLIIVISYFRYKKTKIPKPKVTSINSLLKKPI